MPSNDKLVPISSICKIMTTKQDHGGHIAKQVSTWKSLRGRFNLQRVGWVWKGEKWRRLQIEAPPPLLLSPFPLPPGQLLLLEHLLPTAGSTIIFERAFLESGFCFPKVLQVHSSPQSLILGSGVKAATDRGQLDQG